MADRFREKYFSAYGIEPYLLSGTVTDSEIIYERGDASPVQAKKMLTDKIGLNNIDDTVVLFFTNKEAEELEESLGGIKVRSTAGACGREGFDIHAKGLKISTIKSFKGLEMENVTLVFYESRRGRVTKETIKRYT